MTLSAPPILVTADALAIARGGRVLARDLAFRVEPGEALILRGANGAGKTTLLRTLAGFIPPAEGEVTLVERGGGRRFEAADVAAYLGHADGLLGAETPRAHLSFFTSWSGGAAGTIADAARHFAITKRLDQPARRLSAGQMRRVALARVAASGRPLWLLDEPAASLDDDGQARLTAAIAEHRAAGGSVIAAIHGALDWPDVRTLELKGAGA